MSAVAIVLPVKDKQSDRHRDDRLADTLEVAVGGREKKRQCKISYVLPQAVQSNFASAITSCLTHYRVYHTQSLVQPTGNTD